jgi:molybdopterin converting factor small subunit
MIVLIEFMGRQRAITKTNGLDMPISTGTSVNDALEYVRQRYPELQLDEETSLITVNHEVASLDRVLKANDTVSFLPFIGGG